MNMYVYRDFYTKKIHICVYDQNFNDIKFQIYNAWVNIDKLTNHD